MMIHLKLKAAAIASAFVLFAAHRLRDKLVFVDSDHDLHRSLDVSLAPDVLSEGDYSFARDGFSAAPAHGRVLLYVTSHFSDMHEMYLKYCWRNLVARSPLLQGADVAVYLNPNDPHRRAPAVDALREAFAGNDLTVYLRGPEEKLLRDKESVVKTVGAVRAVQEAHARGYFDGYDWIVRVNPDVLIRDDAPLLEVLANPEMAAAMINCHHATNKLPHTDFFAVRPRALRDDGEISKGVYRRNAERTFEHSLKEEVWDENQYVWLNEASPKGKRSCRAGQGRDFFDTPIVHEHYLHPEVCEVPEAERAAVAEVFPKGWPGNWRLPAGWPGNWTAATV